MITTQLWSEYKSKLFSKITQNHWIWKRLRSIFLFCYLYLFFRR